MIARVQSVAERLASGLPRGLGCANRIADEARDSTGILQELVEALQDKRVVVTVRAANALRKVQKAQPELLHPHARILLRATAECVDTRTRWNLTNVMGDLRLRGKEKELAVELLFDALANESGFLRTFAMTGLVNFAQNDEWLRRRVRPIVQNALDNKSAAMRARACRLHKLLGGAAR